MRLVLDGEDRFVAFGDAEFVAPEGGAVLDVAGVLTLDDVRAADAAARALGGPAEIVYDRATRRLVARLRAHTAAEAEEADRGDLFAQIDAAIDGWANLTAAQRANATLLCLKGLRAIERHLRRGA